MSNTVVGSVYDAIIEDVIKKSKEDFEESGVDESVLEALAEGWRKKLSQLHVASFPWDPKPDTTPAAATKGSSSSAAPPPPSANYATQQLSPNSLNMPLPNAGSAANGQHGTAETLAKMEPDIKQEPGLNPNVMPPPFPDLAAARAQQALQKNYGQRAANSISAIQAGMGQDAARGMPPQGQQMNVSGYRPSGPPVPQGAQGQPQPRHGGQPGPSNMPQTDGCGDMEGVMMRRDADGNLVEMGRVEIDHMLHARIMENAKAMEGGGLMVPLKEAVKHSSATRRARKGAGARGQVDGGDEDIYDEDAINSDLDDSEDDRDDSDVDDDGALGHIMLCMYDKVQRVKNKWKCTLKDGVLTVNRKEYVFHKATGEYEW